MSGGSYQFRHISLQERLAAQALDTLGEQRGAAGRVRARPLIALGAVVLLIVTCLTTIGTLARDASRTVHVGHAAAVRAVVVGRLGDRTIAVSQDTTDLVRAWDVATGRLFGTPFAAPSGEDWATEPVGVTRLGDLDVVVMYAEDGRTRVWDLGTGRPLRGWSENVATHMRNLGDWRHAGTAIVVDHTVAAAVQQGGAVRTWDDIRGEMSSSGEGGGADESMEMARSLWDDHLLAVIRRGDNAPRLWDLTTGRPLGAPLAGVSGMSEVVVGRRAGRITVVARQYGNIGAWNAITGRHSGDVTAVDSAQQVAMTVSPATGKAIGVTIGDRNALQVWDVAKDRLLPAQPPTRDVHEITALAAGFLGDRLVVITGGTDELVRVWDLGRH
ncbi:WD40 repeat domain-containing protein [Nonomuraea basaltis]|uniref:WD40 repeat domain-containing protein n=1 Tax=Nonomuraea basaltis TaxID=2495887 RepID=UPI00110C55CD|nr:hypothetical protein [Nonomuraea basaltis]TMR95859.1 hypothetical protein EJK15_26205 [Nonomuraea basaltis]